MQLHKIIQIASFATLVIGCSTEKPVEAPTELGATPAETSKVKTMATTSTSQPTSKDSANVMPAAAAVKARVADAEARLETSEGGKLIWASIEAHGGLTTWYANGPLAFRFEYKPLSTNGVRDTYQIIDTWSARAHHTSRLAEGESFGWTGKETWVNPPGAKPSKSPRFWALTPYYFVAVPFVFADPGVVLKAEGQIDFEGSKVNIVRVTFDGVGDAPDDYYVLYLDAATSRVRALRYVVTYPGFFEAGKHSPEKLMRYVGEQTIDGVVLAQTLPTYKWDGVARGEKVTDISVSEVSFEPATPASTFAVPEGAETLSGF